MITILATVISPQLQYHRYYQSPQIHSKLSDVTRGPSTNQTPPPPLFTHPHPQLTSPCLLLASPPPLCRYCWVWESSNMRGRVEMNPYNNILEFVLNLLSKYYWIQWHERYSEVDFFSFPFFFFFLLHFAMRFQASVNHFPFDIAKFHIQLIASFEAMLAVITFFNVIPIFFWWSYFM